MGIQFILIDDDTCNNHIINMSLKKYVDADDLRTFTSAEDALEYIRIRNEEIALPKKAIILLDINMPVMNGWEFLERFDKFREKAKMQYKVYMLTSSISKKDIDRSNRNRNVKGYLVKPLTKEKILNLFNEETWSKLTGDQ
jgi:CheY-like chemotaxis protein